MTTKLTNSILRKGRGIAFSFYAPEYKLFYKSTFLMCTMAFMVFNPEIASAAVASAPANLKADTAKVFAESHNHIRSMVHGPFSKIVAIVGFLGALFVGVAQGSLKAILGCLGISFAAGAGPNIVETVTGAVF